MSKYDVKQEVTDKFSLRGRVFHKLREDILRGKYQEHEELKEVAIGEEMGLLGGGAVLILFMLFAVRGLTTAARAKSDLAAFSATGLTAAISFQAFLIVGGVTRLIPLTGVTLPFMSQGGSSLLASFIIVALLLRAGDEAIVSANDLYDGKVVE